MGIDQYEKKSKWLSQFISFAPSFLIGCITAGDVQKALVELLQTTFSPSPNITEAIAKVYQANPIGAIAFIIYLIAWIYYKPRMVPILWMKQAVKEIDL